MIGQIKFDPTISLGTILSGLAIVVTLLGVYWRIAERITGMETKVNAMWRWWIRQMDRMHGNGEDEP